MSILETFYILFKSDTSELKKGTEEAKKTTDKLTDSIKATDIAGEHIGRTFHSIVGQLTAAVAAFVSVGAVIGGLKDALAYDIELGRTSKALGVNVTQLDAWGNAVQRTGGTAQGFQGSLKALAEHFNTTSSVAIKALPQLADVLSKVSRFTAFKYGKSLGLDEATILLLQQGRREVESIIKQQKELGLVTKEQTEIAIKYDNSLVDLKHSFRTLYNAIAIPVTPSITKFLKGFTVVVKYLTEHKDLIVGALTAIGTAFGIIAAEIAIAAGPISLIVIGLTGLVTAIALLYEDISVASKGGNSITGGWWHSLREFFSLLDKKILKVVSSLGEFFKLIKNNRSDLSILNSNIDLTESVRKGKITINDASNTPINSQTSNSIINGQSFARNSSINTGPININTQATDAVGISKEINYGLKYHLRDTVNNFADNNYA